jgi:RNA polymerase sigma-70 factor (sigma-E family)
MVNAAHPVRSGPAPDEAGFRAWMVVRGPALRRKAYLLCGDWSAADDLVQDVLVAMYQQWARIVRGGQVDACASRVLAGKHVDARRRPWRRERPLGRVPDAVDTVSERSFGEVDDREGPLRAGLASLPATQRVVLVLRFTDDLSVEQIAQVLGIPEGTVKSRLSRGTDAMRAHLAAADPDPGLEVLDSTRTSVPGREERS